MPGSNNPSFDYSEVSLDKLIAVAQKLFEFYLLDDVAGNFRRILLIERYHSEKLDKIYQNLFFYGALREEARIFQQMIENNKIKEHDADVLALRFYSPLYFLLQKYDNRPEDVGMALEELSLIIEEFCLTYLT